MMVRDQQHIDGALVSRTQAVGIDSKALIVGLLGQTDDCVKLLGLEGTLDFMNCNGLEAMEIGDFAQVSGRLWWDLWPEEERPRLRSLFDRALAGHESQFKAFCPTALGTPKYWRIRLSPMTSHTGVVVGVLCSSRELRVQPGPA